MVATGGTGSVFMACLWQAKPFLRRSNTSSKIWTECGVLTIDQVHAPRFDEVGVFPGFGRTTPPEYRLVCHIPFAAGAQVYLVIVILPCGLVLLFGTCSLFGPVQVPTPASAAQQAHARAPSAGARATCRVLTSRTPPPRALCRAQAAMAHKVHGEQDCARF